MNVTHHDLSVAAIVGVSLTPVGALRVIAGDRAVTDSNVPWRSPVFNTFGVVGAVIGALAKPSSRLRNSGSSVMHSPSNNRTQIACLSIA